MAKIFRDRLFNNYGIGVGLRPPHYRYFSDSKPDSVNWVEVVTENFIPWLPSQAHHFANNSPFNVHPYKPLQNLLNIRKHVPVALHGVSLSLGSADELDLTYLKQLKELKDLIQPIWISDHLCWTGVNGENIHDLLPIPYSREALNHIARKISQVQSALGQRILIENVSSYVEFANNEMTEWEFINELLELTDCGLLLDVNNVYVSSVNHHFNPKAFIDSLPPQRIGQIHLAGHSVKEGYLIDTHDAPVSAEVWNLYDYTLEKIGAVTTMIERDANIPEWNELEQELAVARRIFDRHLKQKGKGPQSTQNADQNLNGVAYATP